jgi:long-chain acyl-CoA synthetase
VNLGDFPVAKSNEAVLIDCLDWEQPKSYSQAEMDRLTQGCARGLMRAGLQRGDRVGILSGNRAEFLIVWFGILRAGLVAVPVNHKLPAETIEAVLQNADVKLVFCDAVRRPMIPISFSAVQFETEFDGFLDMGSFQTISVTESDDAFVLYTSGSTGLPKGVPLTHGGYLWMLRMRMRGGPHSHHRALVAAPLYHINALGMSMFVFAAQACMVLLPQFNARRYVECIGRFGCTWLTSVPTMMALAMREREALANTDLSSVKLVRMGSAPIVGSLFEDVRRTFPGAIVSNAYGTTEAGPLVFGPSSDGRPLPDGALGWPIPDVEVRVVDSQGQEAEEGILWIRSPSTMKGYLGLPEKTREVLTADGWSITGDVFRRDKDGCYWFVGRSDDMFICGGENIYPSEVELMLEKHPAIAQACVVPVPDDIKGQKPFAFVVVRPGAELNEDDVKRYALSVGAAYQHPRRVVFMKDLPLASTNKVDRAALKRLAMESVANDALKANLS